MLPWKNVDLPCHAPQKGEAELAYPSAQNELLLTVYMGYLAHKKTHPPEDHHRALGIGLL